jgi:hypothetical protein
MANTFKILFRGAASTTSTTLYTVPSNTTTLVSSLVVVNTDSTAATFDMSFDGTQIANDVDVPPNDSLILDLKQVLEASDVISGLASASTVNFHISGLEIS